MTRLGPIGDGAVDARADPSGARLAAENERLHGVLRARLLEEQALRRVATLVARQHAPEAVFDLVAEEVGRHLAAESAGILRYDGPGWATVVATWNPPTADAFPVGRRIEISTGTAAGRVQQTLAPARIDSYEGLEGAYVQELRERGVRATVAAPVLVDGHPWGAVAAASSHIPFTAESEARLGAFAELVAQAILNVDARVKLKESRARIVEAGDDARRRIERNLHDGAQQQLVTVALSLGLVARSADPATAAAIEDCIDGLRAALKELRELARGLHPAELTDRGLPTALRVLAARCPVPVDVDGELGRRPARSHEMALYFVAAESLTNVAKYAKATAATVTLRADDQSVEIVITDDGVGGARVEGGSGLRGLGDRVEALGGRLTVESVPGEGTTVHARLPVTANSAAEISPVA